MAVNHDVVSQGIVLLSILTGFAFVIAADIVLRDPVPEKMDSIAHVFFIAGMFSLMAVGFGIFYFAQEANAGKQQAFGELFAIGLPAAVAVFILSLVGLFYARFSGSLRRITLIITGIVLFLVLLVAWIGIYR